MPTAWFDSAGESFLRPRFEQVVPLVVAFDDSDFGRAARADFLLVTPPAFQQVQLGCAPAEVEVVIKRISSAGFQSSVAPLDLIPGQPTWCCWFQDLTSGRDGDWAACSRNLEQEFPERIRWLLFLKVDDEKHANTLVEQITREALPATLFLLGEKGELNRDVELLAQGSVCLMLAGWERFCTAGELNFERALLLGGNGCGYVLGVGSNGIDLDYHAARWARRIADAVAASWRQPSAGAAKPQLPAPAGVIRQLLPQRGYRIEEPAPDAPACPGVVVGNVEMALAWGGGSDFHPLKGLSNKDNMRHYLSLVQDTRAFLSSVVLPNTRRFMRQGAQPLLERMILACETQLALPQKPDGLFDFLRKRLGSLREPCHHLAQARLNGFAQGEAFSSLLTEAHRRIDAVPSLEGAVLRLVLIAIGLAWLFLGPIVWKGPQPGMTPDLHRGVLLGASVLLVLLVVAVPTSYVLRMRRAIRGIEAARSAMLHAHLWEVCGALVEELRTLGSSLCRILDDKESQIQKLADAFAPKPAAPAAHALENRRPLFPDASVDPLLEPKLTELAAAAYQRFLARLQRDSIQMDADAWKEILKQESAPPAREALAHTSFDQFMTHANPSHMNRKEILENAVAEARQPSLRLPKTAVRSPVLCIAPLAWEAELTDLVNVHPHFLCCRDLVAVSVRPLKQV